jgi:hypothetical protein
MSNGAILVQRRTPVAPGGMQHPVTSAWNIDRLDLLAAEVRRVEALLPSCPDSSIL